MDIETLYFSYGGFHFETEARTISFEGDTVKMEKPAWAGFFEDLDTRDQKQTLFEGVTKDAFLSDLADIHIEKWKDQYDAPVMDGIQWSLEINYDNGDKRSISGSNAYPDNFDRLLKLMKVRKIELEDEGGESDG